MFDDDDFTGELIAASLADDESSGRSGKPGRKAWGDSIWGALLGGAIIALAVVLAGHMLAWW
ncbi:hypothetical protein ABIC83_002904 [Roseateles asaccharophilus]|uniref:hypothetical protein n=1 Tax=Roseateles asaccharophilus TaxID=582607 RepID=UPI0038362935